MPAMIGPSVAPDPIESESVGATEPETWLVAVEVAAGVGVGVADAVGVGVGLGLGDGGGVGLGDGDGVELGVGVGVGVAVACTITVPVMKLCASQWNWYCPGALNRHDPAQPCPCGAAGSGGTAPKFCPALCVQDAGGRS